MKRALKVVVPLLSVAMMGLVMEASFRIAEAVSARRAGEGWAVYDADLGYRLNPAFGDTNAHGLRDHAVAPKNGRFRLLMLGDSVGYYGDDVDDTYVGRLRGQLRQRAAAASVDVLNASVRGYTNYQELVFLKKYGLQLEPDLVGVGFVMNDLHKVLHQFTVRDGRIVGETYEFTPEAVGTVDSWLYRTARKSRLLVWLRRRFSTALATFEYKVDSGYAFDYRPDVNTAWKEAPWTAIDAQMREMVQLGTAHGFRVFVAAFPLAQQYRPEYLTRDREYVLKPQRTLQALCTQLGIPYLDLYPLLGADDFEADGIHLTRSGRERAAAALADFLTAAGLLPVHASAQAAARLEQR